RGAERSLELRQLHSMIPGLDGEQNDLPLLSRLPGIQAPAILELPHLQAIELARVVGLGLVDVGTERGDQHLRASGGALRFLVPFALTGSRAHGDQIAILPPILEEQALELLLDVDVLSPGS